MTSTSQYAFAPDPGRRIRRCDVAVVGAGLAGLWTARLLARAGARVVLLDRRRSVGERLRTTGIFVRRTLEDFALPEDCLGPAIRHVALHAPGGRRLDLESPHPEFRIARMGALCVRLLAEAEQAGAAWWPGTACQAIETTAGGARLRLRGGAAGWLHTRYVVGADGARSRVAEWLGLSRNRRFLAGVEDVYRGIPLEGPPILHSVLSPSLAPGYLAWIAHDGGEVHVGVGGDPARFDPGLALGTFRARLPVLLDWREARLLERRGGLIPVGGVLPRLANTAGLLVGDAAGAVSPLTAGGLDPCLRLSEFAARVIVDFLDRGEAAALAPYRGGPLRRRFASRLALRSLFERLRHPALLDLACQALATAPGRRVAAGVFFGRGSFPDVPRFPAGRRLTATMQETDPLIGAA